MVVVRGRARRCDAKGIDSNDLVGLWIKDQCLRLTAARERVPHRAPGSQHRRRRVNRVAAFAEDQRASGRRERLAGDGEPMLRV